MFNKITVTLPCGHYTYAQVNDSGTLISDTHICKACGKKFNLEFGIWKEEERHTQTFPGFIR